MTHNVPQISDRRRILALAPSIEMQLPVPGARVEVGVVRPLRPWFDRDPRPTSPGGMKLAVAA